ncbi:MAG: radical SAM protein [Sedimentisphaerales bacterium]|nr:radical SAM protein [Sedimentisphaerales bacterium]
MRVTEIFHSLQGEGMLAGVPSVFVRLAGCPLRCRWCDTAYAWDYSAGTEHTLDGLVAEVGRIACRHVVVTGGEPLVGPNLTARPGLVDLTCRLKDLGKHVTIETAGVLFVPGLACDLMSLSLKLSHSTPLPADLAAEHERIRRDLEQAKALIETYPYQLKFVIESHDDSTEVMEILGRLGSVDRERVLLMPQARRREEMVERAPMVAELCLETGFRFGPRLQTTVWDNRRGR